MHFICDCVHAAVHQSLELLQSETPLVTFIVGFPSCRVGLSVPVASFPHCHYLPGLSARHVPFDVRLPAYWLFYRGQGSKINALGTDV